jgi:hypothetical protein
MSKRTQRACCHCRRRKVKCKPNENLPGKQCGRCLKHGLLCKYVKVGSDGPLSTSSHAGRGDHQREDAPQAPMTFSTFFPDLPFIPAETHWMPSTLHETTVVDPFPPPLDHTSFPLEGGTRSFVSSSTTYNPELQYAHVVPSAATSLHDATGR